MEGNITHTLLKNQKSNTWGKSFKCMIKRMNLTNLCTRLDIFFLPPVAPIFPFQTCKVEFNQPSYWLYSVPNLLVFQHLVTLYLGGFVVRVVNEIEC